LSRIVDVLARDEVVRQHDALARLDAPDRLDDPDRVGPDRERPRRRIVARQFSLDIGLEIRKQRGRLDPHETAAGARRRHGDVLQRQTAAEFFETPGFHETAHHFAADDNKTRATVACFDGSIMSRIPQARDAAQAASSC
jgi:hypothetical protein